MSTCRMKALSLEPPGRRGVLRGCGSVGVRVEVVEEAGGERMKPPLEARL